jgi:4-hydroxybenzoate polyprenyltransferase
VATSVAALAWVAGASWPVIALLGLGMFGLQVSLGALNDLVDVERDRRARRAKPIPAGDISRRTAGLVVLAGATTGLVVSASFGAAVLMVGSIGFGAGVLYDVTSRRALVGPLAFAVALPALLVWTWLAAASTLPPGAIVLLPLAALAGPALHLANGMADLEPDERAGATSMATALGRRRSGNVLLALDIAIWTLAWLSLALIGPISDGALLVMAAASAVAALGAGLSVVGRTAASSAGWMLGAIALALLAVAWGATAAA